MSGDNPRMRELIERSSLGTPAAKRLRDSVPVEVGREIVRRAEEKRHPDVIVCWSRCWPCQFDQHRTPPEWHTWADDDDIAWALENGRPDPSDQKCACPCAGPKSAEGRQR